MHWETVDWNIWENADLEGLEPSSPTPPLKIQIS